MGEDYDPRRRSEELIKSFEARSALLCAMPQYIPDAVRFMFSQLLKSPRDPIVSWRLLKNISVTLLRWNVDIFSDEYSDLFELLFQSPENKTISKDGRSLRIKRFIEYIYDIMTQSYKNGVGSSIFFTNKLALHLNGEDYSFGSGNNAQYKLKAGIAALFLTISIIRGKSLTTHEFDGSWDKCAKFLVGISYHEVTWFREDLAVPNFLSSPDIKFGSKSLVKKMIELVSNKPNFNVWPNFNMPLDDMFANRNVAIDFVWSINVSRGNVSKEAVYLLPLAIAIVAFLKTGHNEVFPKDEIYSVYSSAIDRKKFIGYNGMYNWYISELIRGLKVDKPKILASSQEDLKSYEGIEKWKTESFRRFIVLSNGIYFTTIGSVFSISDKYQKQQSSLGGGKTYEQYKRAFLALKGLLSENGITDFEISISDGDVPDVNFDNANGLYLSKEFVAVRERGAYIHYTLLEDNESSVRKFVGILRQRQLIGKVTELGYITNSYYYKHTAGDIEWKSSEEPVSVKLIPSVGLYTWMALALASNEIMTIPSLLLLYCFLDLKNSNFLESKEFWGQFDIQK